MRQDCLSVILRGWIFGFCALACLGCGDSTPAISSQATGPEVHAPTQERHAEAPSARRAVSRSQHAGRRHLEMEVSGASLDDALTLQVRFVNRHDESFALVGELGGEDFLLVETDGSLASPRSFDPSLQRLGSDGTMAPRQERRGSVVFAPPRGSSFELRFADFAPLPLVLDRPVERSVAESREAPPAAPTAEAPGQSRKRQRRASETADAELRTALQHVLDRHAKALEQYDGAAYLDTFIAAVRSREQPHFNNIRSLPLSAVELRLGEVVASRQGDPALQTTAQLRYGLDGQPPDNPFVHELRLVWRRQGAGWRLADMEDLGDRPVPWRVEALSVHRSHHFLLVTEGRRGEPLVDLAADAEAAYASLYRQGLPLAQGYFVHLVTDRQLFARLAGRPSALGVAVARQSVDGGRVVVDSRAFFVNGSVFLAGRGEAARHDLRRVTVTHELVHLALAEHTRPFTPIWLKEGAAVFFSEDLTYDGNRAFVQRGLDGIDLARLTKAPVLGQHDLGGQRTADEYIYAGNLVSYLVDLKGKQALVDFYASFAELPAHELATIALGERALAGSRNVDGASLSGKLAARLGKRQLQRHYGLEVPQLEADLAAWLRLRYR